MMLSLPKGATTETTGEINKVKCKSQPQTLELAATASDRPCGPASGFDVVRHEDRTIPSEEIASSRTMVPTALLPNGMTNWHALRSTKKQ